MSSDLFSIGRSGAAVARIALDVTAQNIANAASEGYVRRSATIGEVASTGGALRVGDISLSGARLTGIVRNADPFRQADVRCTGSDLARAEAELSGLRNIETAVEQTGVYPAVVAFRSSLDRLAADPTDPALRGAVLEDARTMTRTFTIAAQQLDSAGESLRFEAGALTGQTNVLAGELARVNLGLARTAAGTSDRSALLDRRDALLGSLSEAVDIATTFAPDGTVTVRVGGAGGPALVALGETQPLALTAAADGTLAFTLGGAAVVPAAGALAGKAQALTRLATTRGDLDAAANTLIATLNAAQAGGAALDGSPGSAMLAGTGARDIALLLTSGDQLATAPAGSPAGSRDGTNLAALRSAFAASDPAGALDALLFGLSGVIAGRTVTRDALATIAASARDAFSAEAGVNLDQEAVNLVRFQQAFQASGRVLQTAATLFDTLLSIR